MKLASFDSKWFGFLVILVVLVGLGGFLLGQESVNPTGAVFDDKYNPVANKAIDFINKNIIQSGSAFIKSVEETSGIYKIGTDYQGNNITVFATKDGKYIMLKGYNMDNYSAPNSGSQNADIPKNDEPKVELFVMSYCPYGTQMEKATLPAVKKLGEKIQFNVKFVDYVMHGKKEIDEQLLQYCLQKEKERETYVDYLSCFLEEEDNTEECLDEVGVEKNELETCIEETDDEYNIMGLYNDKTTWENGRYPQFPIYEDLNEEYGITGSPGLVVNGKKISVERTPQALLEVVCSAFKNKPNECDTQLSTEKPSAGLG